MSPYAEPVLREEPDLKKVFTVFAINLKAALIQAVPVVWSTVQCCPCNGPPSRENGVKTLYDLFLFVLRDPRSRALSRFEPSGHKEKEYQTH